MLVYALYLEFPFYSIGGVNIPDNFKEMGY